MEPLPVSFLLRSVYDVLPSSSNLLKWVLLETSDCQLFGGNGIMTYMLSGCKLAQQQRRYRLRHDQVFRSLADTLEAEGKKSKLISRDRPTGIRFVRAGETARTSSERGSILRWLSVADEGGPRAQTRLPRCVMIQTTLHPDIVLWSAEDKIIIIELTVPWEEGCDKAHE